MADLWNAFDRSIFHCACQTRSARRGYAGRIGVDERTLAETPVLDPARTVQTDVHRVLWAAEIPADVRVSGHVYDVGTGLVTTVVDAKTRD